uniref:SIT4 phosphatase-associated family protein n=2 Tax=Oryza TaxID=4527 RepID=A0A0E0PE76_ORYRU
MKTLVENEDLMDLLFSYLKPDRPHGTLLAGYFCKVVICLMLRKTLPFVNYVQGHPEIVSQLVDLIGITSIMEVLIRLIGADETMYSGYVDSMQWLDDIKVLEMIVDKFSSSDSPEVHANAAEILCAITRYAPPALATKISSASFVARLFHHAFEDSRPKSVLVHSLSVCISLLDPKRLVLASYQVFRSQLSHATLVTASPETVGGMLDSLGDLLKLLDVSSAENVLPTTYGVLQPPLGKHRLKIVEFISVLLSIGSEAAEIRLIHLGAIKRDQLICHVLDECKLVTRILEAEKNSALSIDLTKHTVPLEGRFTPRIGLVGHMTRISNKLIQLAKTNSIIQSHLQQNSGWAEWHAGTLTRRNAVENVYQWACGRPTTLQDRGRDSDEEDFRDRDYDDQVPHERDDEDVYFDDESAEVVISSLRLGDEHDSNSLFTNSNWFAFDEDKALNGEVNPEASPSPNSEISSPNVDDENDEVILTEVTDGRKGSESLLAVDLNEESSHTGLTNVSIDKLEDDIRPPTPDVKESPPEFVEWREEEAEPADVPENDTAVPNGEVGSVDQMDGIEDVMSGTTELRVEKEIEVLSGTSVPESTIGELLPGSTEISTTRHPEPVDDRNPMEPPMGEQKAES